MKISRQKKRNMMSGMVLNNGIFGVYGRSYNGTFYNPESLTLQQYEKMLTDETVLSGLKFTELAVISKIGKYSHRRKRISKFVNEQFESMRGSIVSIFEGILTALWAGFSVGEIIWEEKKGKVNIKDIQFIDPKYITFNLETEGLEKNRVKDITIFNVLDNLPSGKSLIYSHWSKFGNPYGTSKLKSVYAPYYIKIDMLPSWAKTMDRYGSPPALAKIDGDIGETIVDQDGDSKTLGEVITQTLDDLQDGKSVAYSGNTEISVLQTQRPLGQDFQAVIEYCNKMIYRGLLIPSLLESGEKGGSYALGQTHFDLFLLSMASIRNEVCELMLEQVIRPLITWNFGEQDEWGTFSQTEFNLESAKAFAEIFDKMVNRNVISTEILSDVNEMREKLGFSEINEIDWKDKQEKQAIEKAKIEERLDKQREVIDSAMQGKREQERIEEVESEQTEPEEKVNEKFSKLLNGVNSYFVV